MLTAPTTRRTTPSPKNTSSEPITPKIETTNAAIDRCGPTAYVAPVSASVHEMLYSPAGTRSTERATTYQVSELIVTCSDPLTPSRGTSAPVESFASHGGVSTGTDA
ncbi:hypothetical protein E1218_24345 [Kribbella turkmenica]|uniref:Uncharacterized protein n=1 Tax=Kribbella turkmenica TaxID=2530375 RepID=A0A4R4WL93_9ACTN|nr:hypothetical protein [Kribbella turkmenica]TDD19281.1 hypothetical protein E1218_24345 [Kribbella turkmenica]